jgi:hypothetical protein
MSSKVPDFSLPSNSWFGDCCAMVSVVSSFVAAEVTR